MQATANGTTYTIEIDATSTVLGELQAQNFTLLAYKGASGPNQVSAGMPTWFAQPFINLFTPIDIEYTPVYQVYISSVLNVAPNTIINMAKASLPVGLGTSLVFNADGTFTQGGAGTAGSIALTNNRPAGTPPLVVGLAAMINGVFSPFCAFTCPPQNAVQMTPHESVAFFAARTALQSGSVTANATAPGSSFAIQPTVTDYTLQVQDSTFAIVGTGSTITTVINAGDALSILNS
ncbi:hypothetical protein E5K02_02580 [Hymenobacter metallicola]|uniref:Uncharacterized protein n=1 Tax=Hymenobacter metallicola TaxID=2563114 RepID=A0A4Z0QMH5_9BACT|nr:hypothetical protein E5K02_02580 [Hymenobacter metallicola]